MSTSHILSECLHIEKTSSRNATHFILCYAGKIRYIIALQGGKIRLHQNIKAYSSKLHVLMKAMNVLPLQLLHYGKFGYFASVIPCEPVQKNLQKTGLAHWNVIVGTYDERQKLVFQCFEKQKRTQYVKVGGCATEVEMRTEIEYLKTNHDHCGFLIPKLIGYEMMSETCPYTIQITEEFTGKKVEPVLTEEIIGLYQSICKKNPLFSHGDFAPWNLRKAGDQYIVFDWEHCGIRTEGYDLAYFVTMTGVTLGKKTPKIALKEGIQEIKKFLPDFQLDEMKFMESFLDTAKELR